MKHTILVTGASSGFGLLIVKQIHQKSCQVKGASLFVTLQHFAYKTFENAINKRVIAAT